jgi:hypothetical protein
MEQRRAGFITWKISSTDPSGIAGLIRDDCRRLLERQHDKFRQIYRECERLEDIVRLYYCAKQLHGEC